MSKLRMVLAFWLVPFSVGTWRRFGHAFLTLPWTVAGPLGAIRDRPKPSRTNIAAYLIASLAIGLLCWALLDIMIWMLIMNFLYPIRGYMSIGFPYHGGNVPLLFDIHRVHRPFTGRAWGGPTLAGVWVVHAGLVLLVGYPLQAWALRGLTRLHARLTRTLLA